MGATDHNLTTWGLFSVEISGTDRWHPFLRPSRPWDLLDEFFSQSCFLSQKWRTSSSRPVISQRIKEMQSKSQVFRSMYTRQPLNRRAFHPKWFLALRSSFTMQQCEEWHPPRSALMHCGGTCAPVGAHPRTRSSRSQRRFSRDLRL